MNDIGKIFRDEKENHVVVVESKLKTPEGFAFPVSMYRIKYMNIDKEIWFSRLLFYRYFKEVN